MLGGYEEGQREAWGMPPGGRSAQAHPESPHLPSSLGPPWAQASLPLAPHPGEPSSGPGARTGALSSNAHRPWVSVLTRHQTRPRSTGNSQEYSQRWGSGDWHLACVAREPFLQCHPGPLSPETHIQQNLEPCDSSESEPCAHGSCFKELHSISCLVVGL